MEGSTRGDKPITLNLGGQQVTASEEAWMLFIQGVQNNCSDYFENGPENVKGLYHGLIKVSAPARGSTQSTK